MLHGRQTCSTIQTLEASVYGVATAVAATIVAVAPVVVVVVAWVGGEAGLKLTLIAGRC